jgi:hypothetical protein
MLRYLIADAHCPATGRRRTGHALLLGLLLAFSAPALCGNDTKQVIGWIERVKLTTDALTIQAKVDTGADYSSVHAEDLRYFLRGNMRWVEFTLHDDDGAPHRLQRPVERMAKVKKKTTGHQERPVVVLELCVGRNKRKAQVNLADRGHFRYPLLLGRNFLGGQYLVDSGAKYTLRPDCN